MGTTSEPPSHQILIQEKMMGAWFIVLAIYLVIAMNVIDMGRRRK